MHIKGHIYTKRS